MEYQGFWSWFVWRVQDDIRPLKTKGEGRVVIYWMPYPNTNNGVVIIR